MRISRITVEAKDSAVGIVGDDEIIVSWVEYLPHSSASIFGQVNQTPSQIKDMTLWYNGLENGLRIPLSLFLLDMGLPFIYTRQAYYEMIGGMQVSVGHIWSIQIYSASTIDPDFIKHFREASLRAVVEPEGSYPIYAAHYGDTIPPDPVGDPGIISPDNGFDTSVQIVPFCTFYILPYANPYFEDHELTTKSTRFNVGEYYAFEGAVYDGDHFPKSVVIDVQPIDSDVTLEGPGRRDSIRFDCTARWVSDYGYTPGRWESLHGDRVLTMSPVSQILSGGEAPVFLDENNFSYFSAMTNRIVEEAALSFDTNQQLYTNGTNNWVTTDDLAFCVVAVVNPPRGLDDSIIAGFLPPNNVTEAMGLVVSINKANEICVSVGDEQARGDLSSPRYLITRRLPDAPRTPIVIGLQIHMGSPINGDEFVTLHLKTPVLNTYDTAAIPLWGKYQGGTRERLVSAQYGLMTSASENNNYVLETAVWLDGVGTEQFRENMKMLGHVYGLSDGLWSRY